MEIPTFHSLLSKMETGKKRIPNEFSPITPLHHSPKNLFKKSIHGPKMASNELYKVHELKPSLKELKFTPDTSVRSPTFVNFVGKAN